MARNGSYTRRSASGFKGTGTTVFEKPKRRKIDREGVEQKGLMLWLRGWNREVWEHTFHVPNGGSRHKLEAANLKAQGVKAGVPDIFIEIPRGGFHGLRIELKATPPHDAKVTDSQSEWGDRLSKQGYRAVVCRGIEAAKAEIKAYLSLEY